MFLSISVGDFSLLDECDKSSSDFLITGVDQLRKTVLGCIRVVEVLDDVKMELGFSHVEMLGEFFHHVVILLIS